MFPLGRHLLEGEILFMNNLHFLVLSCQPNNGIVNETTEIRIDGDPVVDINDLTISIKSVVGSEELTYSIFII